MASRVLLFCAPTFGFFDFLVQICSFGILKVYMFSSNNTRFDSTALNELNKVNKTHNLSCLAICLLVYFGKITVGTCVSLRSCPVKMIPILRNINRMLVLVPALILHAILTPNVFIISDLGETKLPDICQSKNCRQH